MERQDAPKQVLTSAGKQAPALFFYYMASKEEKALYNKIMSLIDVQMQPQSNPAQDFLTNQALAGADYLNKGDFSSLPKGMYFDFELPSEQLKNYKNLTNAGAEGTFALGADDGGLQKNYLSDKFARDASLNYQNNIKDASDNIKAGLSQAAGAKSGNDSAIISGLEGMMGKSPQGFQWSSLLPGAMNMGTSLLTKFL